MRANANTVLVGSSVVLVPYSVEHVATYHGWMLDERLRELTASEPLTLEEEYDMQRKWQNDEDKLTFIVLAREQQHAPLNPDAVRALPMIGDVNLFLKGTPPRLRTTTSEGDEDEFEAEVEIMIAEPAYRRQGRASEALRLFLDYATSAPPHTHAGPFPPLHRSPDLDAASASANVSPLPVPRSALVTRIGAANAPSIALFERAGFEVTRRVQVFDEVEMRVAR